MVDGICISVCPPIKAEIKSEKDLRLHLINNEFYAYSDAWNNSKTIKFFGDNTYELDGRWQAWIISDKNTILLMTDDPNPDNMFETYKFYNNGVDGIHIRDGKSPITITMI